MMLPTEPQKKKWLFVLVLVAIYIWAFAGIPLAAIKENVGQILGGNFLRIDPSRLSYVYTGDGEDLFSLMIETVAIAFVGTFISSLLSIPFAFWAARSKKYT